MHRFYVIVIAALLSGVSCGAPSNPVHGVTTLPATRKAASSRPGGEITPPPRRNVPGERLTLSCGELYIPDFFTKTDKPTQLIVWSLGAAWCAQQNFYDARKNAVLLNLNGSEQKAGFADPAKFQALLDETNAAMLKAFPECPPIGKVCLGSFSGGYPVVRDLLRHKQFQPLITDVVLADSLYAGKVPGSDTQLIPEQMQPFLDFARRAAAGEVTFYFSHLFPPEERYRGNTTTLAASYLIDHLNIPRVDATGTNSAGAQLLYRADQKGFHILGYAGMLNQDHFNHFYGSGDLIKMTSLSDAK